MNRESDYLEESKIDLSDTHTHMQRRNQRSTEKPGSFRTANILGNATTPYHTHTHTHTHTHSSFHVGARHEFNPNYRFVGLEWD